MRFRTLVLALALVCGLTASGEAAKRPPAHKVKTGNIKPSKVGKVSRFKSSRYKAHKRVVNKRVVKR
jgi:hypothetical protein